LKPTHLNKLLSKYLKDCEDPELTEDIINFYWNWVRKTMVQKPHYNLNVKGLGSFVVNEKKLNGTLAKTYEYIQAVDRKEFESYARYNDAVKRLESLKRVKDQIVKEKDKRIKIRQANYADQNKNNLEE
jgi:hypothetical protein